MDNVADKLAIMEQLAHFCRVTDAYEVHRLGEIFHRDIAWDFKDGDIVRGVDALIGRVSGTLDAYPNQGSMMHNVSNIVITIAGDTAESIANCAAAHEGAGAFAGQTYFAWPTYNDFWIRTGEGWRIVKRIYRIQFSHGPREIVYGAPIT